MTVTSRRLHTAGALLMASAGIAGLLMPHAARAEDKVVATVNGKPITEQDMSLAEAEIGNDLGGNIAPATKRRVLAEYLIENILFADAAETDKLGEGKPFDERMKYWRRRALRDAYFEKTVKSAIGEGAAKTFYEDQVKAVKPEEEIQARHILVDTEDLAKEIAGKLKAGGDFAALAKEKSKDTGSKEDGGMLGYFGRGQMVPPFEEAAFGLKKGEISAPVKSQFGWHIIKLEDRRAKKLPTFEEVKERIMASMIHHKAQELSTQMREKAKVEFIDADLAKQMDEQKKQMEGQKKMMEEQIKKLQDNKSASDAIAKDGATPAKP